MHNIYFQLNFKVHDDENAKHVDDPSSFSKFAKFLIFIRFVPVKVNSDNSKVTFKLCSCVMFSGISILWIPLFLMLGAGEMIGRRIQEFEDVYIKEYNVVDEIGRSLKI